MRDAATGWFVACTLDVDMVHKLVPRAPDEGLRAPGAGAAIVGPTLAGLGPSGPFIDDERDTLDESLDDSKGSTLHGLGDLDRDAPRPGADAAWSAAQRELLDVLGGVQAGPRPAFELPASGRSVPTHCWPERSSRANRAAPTRDPAGEPSSYVGALASVHPAVWFALMAVALVFGVGLGATLVG